MPMLTSKNTNLNSNAQNVRNSFAKASSDNKQKSRVVVLFVLVKKNLPSILGTRRVPLSKRVCCNSCER